MNITFEKQELAEFVAKLETWHRERFEFVLFNVATNIDRYDFLAARSESVAKGIITKFDDLFKKEHPKPEWKELI